MHGFLKMLTGEGERLNREAHQKFRDAIPNNFPFIVGNGDDAVVKTGVHDYRDETKMDFALPTHPAYCWKSANTMMASNYRRAVYGGRGPMPKKDYQSVDDISEWIATNGIPLEGGE